ncbi:MAG: fluoride efflux transporter CrcB [Gammaproteobacteria bacterium]|nr:fluoride efflux transporter CrcB [Gammaproteobacteria bacterium]
MHLALVAAGGAFGSVARFLVSATVQRWAAVDFPYGTLSVNVIGSLLMGILYVLLLERTSLGTEWRALLLIGVLGGFTTFSSFSIETMVLIEQAQLLKAMLNIVTSVTLCLVVTWLGILLARWL